jgi:hypothetical protein
MATADEKKTMMKNMKQIFIDESCFGKLELPWKRALLAFKKLSQDSNVTIFTTPATRKALEAMLDKHFGRTVEKEFNDTIYVVNADGSQKMDMNGKPVTEKKKRKETVRELEISPVFNEYHTEKGKIGFLVTILQSMSWDAWVIDTSKKVLAGIMGSKDYDAVLEFNRQLDSGFRLNGFLISDTNDWQSIVKTDDADLREAKPANEAKKPTGKSTIT